jgi:23S rRNA (cytidine1920-2'-O)/16S rRNA (cytidine1409-2'-O)-methyltransferase
MKQRLDHALVQRRLTPTRSQAESWVRLGRVKVAGKLATKPGMTVHPEDAITLDAPEQYVSRAGLKLASVANKFSVQFAGATVLDVGSSTGGFTDYALQHGARKVYAIDVGTDQLHPSLRGDSRIVLHEKTDIRDFKAPEPIDIVVIDVSFIRMNDILPAVLKSASAGTTILAMVKPQFEATRAQLTKTGIVKNERYRRDILREFEAQAKQFVAIVAKADSEIAGTHGNQERFYQLKTLA